MRQADTEGESVNKSEAKSIMQMAIDAQKCCYCMCKQQPSEDNDREGSFAGQVPSLVLPNLNQDLWLEFLDRNLSQLKEFRWAQSLKGALEIQETQFNSGKYRGELFHLNFYAFEALQFQRKIAS